ncbi:MAG TPA: BlaI/MecI/CopY family transcriptional regulator [Ruminococcus sp.]|nr:BlaI/MecI/CopY family transcriptional regulator [Ruminococcus sp.]
MKSKGLGAVESRFADIVWANEPLKTSELVRICSDELNWKRTTTYTVLKRLSDRGLFENNGGLVSAKITRDEFYLMQGESLVDEAFNGSLPVFLAAFTSNKRLSREDVDEIRRLIDSYEEK